MKGHFAAIALIVIGAIALGVKVDLVALIRKWWPLALIALGVGLFLTPDDRSRR